MSNGLFSFLMKYIVKLKGLIISMTIGQFVGEICAQGAIFYGSRIVGAISSDGPKEQAFHQALWYAVLFGLLYLIRGLITNGLRHFEAYALPRFSSRISHDLFRNAHQHSLHFFTQEMSGKIAQQIRRMSMGFMMLYSRCGQIFQTIIKMIISMIIIGSVNLLVACVIFGFLMFYFYLLYIMGNKIQNASQKSSHAFSVGQGVFVDTMFNYALIKSYAQLNFERRHYFKTMRDYVTADKKVFQIEGFTYMTQGFLRAVLQLVTLSIPFYYWVNNQLSVADFVLIESLVTYLTLYGMSIVGSITRLYRAIGTIEDGYLLLSQPLGIENLPHARNIRIKKAAIKIEHIDFKYADSKPVFKNFSLSIAPYEKIGLVGHSGSGKSTLTKLISRYYDLNAGRIKINAYDLTDFTLDSLHKNIAVIPQDPSLFNRTIMENIRYGKLDATDEEVYAAAKKAYCHDFIMALPNGYESKVGERGVSLSGGERQRIAIARAILKNAPILILDEATSALDSESEMFIQKSLKTLMQNKTVIAIAHRLSTLREMDRLVVLDKGKIVEQGSHKELLKAKGTYATFYHFQAKHFSR